MANVIATRALNPDYPMQLATLPEVRLYGELAYLEAASLRLEWRSGSPVSGSKRCSRFDTFSWQSASYSQI